MKKTTKLSLLASLAISLLLPALASADVMHRGKSGTLVCSANGSSNNYYYFTNHNTKRGLKIKSIQITDSSGKIIKRWTVDKKMPLGLPKDGVIPARGSLEVKASEIAKGITSTNSPFRSRITWKTTNNTVGTQPAIALVRNFYDGTGARVSQRASNCQAVRAGD